VFLNYSYIVPYLGPYVKPYSIYLLFVKCLAIAVSD